MLTTDVVEGGAGGSAGGGAEEGKLVLQHEASVHREVLRGVLRRVLEGC